MNIATVRRLGRLSGIVAAVMFGVGAGLSARDATPGGRLTPLRLMPDSLASRIWKSDFERLGTVLDGEGSHP
jgi:hypothetical protein